MLQTTSNELDKSLKICVIMEILVHIQFIIYHSGSQGSWSQFPLTLGNFINFKNRAGSYKLSTAYQA